MDNSLAVFGGVLFILGSCFANPNTTLLCFSPVVLPTSVLLNNNNINNNKPYATVAYGLIASFVFFWIPLSYFYFEELEEGQSVRQRLLASFKYTIFFILIACTLLITGLFMKPNKHEDVDLDWLRRMLANLGKLKRSPSSVTVFYVFDIHCEKTAVGFPTATPLASCARHNTKVTRWIGIIRT